MQKSSKVFLATACLVVVNVIVGAYFLLRAPRETNPNITTPILAVSALESKSLYFTPAARACLMATKPALLAPGDSEENSERAQSFARAAQDPGLWRKLDHQFQFDTLLLCGDPAHWHPLLKHLLASGDWILTYLDHTSLVFKRPPARLWSPVDLDALRKNFTSCPAPEQTMFLVQAAGKLMAVTRYTLAKQLLDDALRLDPKSPDVWTQQAFYHAHFGQWQQVLEKTGSALAIDKNYQPALVTRAQAFLAMRQFDDALELSDRLAEMSPHDAEILFLHARISHEAHAYSREISALRTLIELAESHHQPVSGYRIYLAQAHAASGEALPALEQFQKALAAGDLSPEQQQYVKESIDRIKSRM